MLFIYSILLMIAFVLLSPLLILKRGKYTAGLKQRFGIYPEFSHDGRPVIWLHCVSVGEANAARPLVKEIRRHFPSHRLVISTTTKTGQELAQKIFKGDADVVFYFPFDWKFSVRRALRNFKPSIVLLMETEIWPRFIRESKESGAKVTFVNGRLSEKSAGRYSMLGGLIGDVLADVDCALMQSESDASRIKRLGMSALRVQVTGNLKFDHGFDESEIEKTDSLKTRFGFDGTRPLVIAASTHEPEEKWVLSAFLSTFGLEGGVRSRLLVAPRHPERFDAVARLIADFRNDPDCEYRDYSFVRRASSETGADKTADIVLLDTIGELRAAYPLASIVIVGGSMIPHGGQSVLEPAAAGKAIITGPYTHNFETVMRVFLANDAVIQMPELKNEQFADEMFLTLSDLLEDVGRCEELGRNATAVMNANRGATRKTIDYLRAQVF